ncbi:peptidase [Polymorphobacter sp. PAMC 29334]|uniref:M14 family metallopeptidase n=1 Tax=Polymorphobacter sp. PAMC 29334 TaxID=2862331 RepID=UPI001C78F120|nr:M14 metallopeptidase family protein [Polymorphobacter sp. PAMC 29334]QYE36576.1 peptidase [Polymorphobacter sp. PAMC 29334]
MRRFRGGSFFAAVLAAIIAIPGDASDAPATTITNPAALLKFEPGADYVLANYTQISAWLHQIAGESDRIKLISIGKTAEGRDQYMAIVSSPENIRNLDRLREISRRLALAKGMTDDEAHKLAAEGRSVVWMDAGLHATEVVPAQSHIEIIHEMLTRNDPETLRLLGDDIMLFVFANPDGLELVSNWYMRPADKAKRVSDTIPILYQKYIGHDDNRDSFASTQPETTNMNRAAYRDWFPQILYNQHQTGPLGAVVFIPPFRDPYNFNNEPLVINQTDIVGEMMHARLVAQGKGGSVMRSGAPYSTWFNGGVRTIGYFHNQIGILTEIIGNPTPFDLPLVPANQLAREDEVMPIAPQKWHFQQSLDYMKEMDRAILDYASRYRETVLFNRYVMGRNQIAKGSSDSWIVTPKRIEALKTAAAAIKTEHKGTPLDGLTGYNSRDIVPASLYQTVLQDPAMRAPRAYIIPGDRQPDMPTTIKFLNALIKTGIEVERADAPFTFAGVTYPAGSFVVRTDQAFRPHVLDMFEPQDHPQDFAYPGGPPIKPYDVTGYTLALQMNVRFDRVLDTFAPKFPAVADVIDAPPAGHIVGEGLAGFVVSHATNNSFTLSNRLLKARLPVFWLKSPTIVAGATLAPGALWIPASARAKAIVAQSVGPLGIDAYAVAAKPAGDTIAVKPARIGLVDIYGGSMASGWTRWLFDQFEFPYTRVYPQELDKGRLDRKYDVLILQSDILGREEGGGREQPKAEDIPVEYRAMLGRISAERTYPAIASFAKAGGTVIAVGDASRIGPALGVPVKNILVTAGGDGKDKPISSSKFYVPGSIVTVKVDVADPLAYGVPETVNMFYNNNPVFSLTSGATTARQVAGYYNDDPLVSGWAWGQKLLNGNASIVDATLGRGRVYLIGGEVTQRGQPYATFKFLFNGIFAGRAEAHRGS